MGVYPLDEVLARFGELTIEAGGSAAALDYGNPMAEYRASLDAAGIHDARERGLIEVTGQDRAAWLHNLVTNTVKTLRPGEGVYAFATSAKGRILFDCHVLALQDAIWVDVDRQLVGKAIEHFERYHIGEDVRLMDRSDEYCRVILLGPKAAEIVATLGATQAGSLPAIGSTQVMLAGKPRLMVRNDAFAGAFGLELHVEAADAAACWERLMELGRPVIRPVGRTAVDVLRIEAGIPVYGQDIDEEVVPAETQQNERAVSYEKGCYLGQEIVERMRSRGSLGRKLVGLRLSGSAGVHPGAALTAEGSNVGRLTSACESYAAGGTIGLGYVRIGYAEPGTRLRVDVSIDAEVVTLPLRR
jgi:folate-binding protein YgfZ